MSLEEPLGTAPVGSDPKTTGPAFYRAEAGSENVLPPISSAAFRTVTKDVKAAWRLAEGLKVSAALTLGFGAFGAFGAGAELGPGYGFLAAGGAVFTFLVISWMASVLLLLAGTAQFVSTAHESPPTAQPTPSTGKG
ncbi:MAG: hypothetical protein QOE58_3064 [Actinomycetota bacterium]|nr:hypothetical protein [Actinomycetota bacterium]